MCRLRLLLRHPDQNFSPSSLFGRMRRQRRRQGRGRPGWVGRANKREMALQNCSKWGKHCFDCLENNHKITSFSVIKSFSLGPNGYVASKIFLIFLLYGHFKLGPEASSRMSRYPLYSDSFWNLPLQSFRARPPLRKLHCVDVASSFSPVAPHTWLVAFAGNAMDYLQSGSQLNTFCRV